MWDSLLCRNIVSEEYTDAIFSLHLLQMAPINSSEKHPSTQTPTEYQQLCKMWDSVLWKDMHTKIVSATAFI